MEVNVEGGRKRRTADDRWEINVTHRLYRISPEISGTPVSVSFDLSSTRLFLLLFHRTPARPALTLRTKQRRNIVRDLRKVSSEIVCVITFWRGSSGAVPKIRFLLAVPRTAVTGQYPERGKDKGRNQRDDSKENKGCN